jgi:hypothetical protein
MQINIISTVYLWFLCFSLIWAFKVLPFAIICPSPKFSWSVFIARMSVHGPLTVFLLCFCFFIQPFYSFFVSARLFNRRILNLFLYVCSIIIVLLCFFLFIQSFYYYFVIASSSDHFILNLFGLFVQSFILSLFLFAHPIILL